MVSLFIIVVMYYMRTLNIIFLFRADKIKLVYKSES